MNKREYSEKEYRERLKDLIAFLSLEDVKRMIELTNLLKAGRKIIAPAPEGK